MANTPRKRCWLLTLFDALPKVEVIENPGQGTTGDTPSGSLSPLEGNAQADLFSDEDFDEEFTMPGLRHSPLTAKCLLELIEHEGIVPEWYKDSVGVGTWGIGVTNKSGHMVDRYRDNPQSIQRVLEIFIWLITNNYLPAVYRAFGDYPLNEHELAGALSFHYNTGGIERATWVEQVVEGQRDKAMASIMNWRSPPEILSRRNAERRLFFDGVWTSDGVVPVWSVSKPSYTPKGARMVDIRLPLRLAMDAQS